MNKKIYISVLISLVFVILLLVVSNKENDLAIKLEKGETILRSVSKDLDEDGKPEKILLTRISTDPPVVKDKLYVENRINNPSVFVAGVYFEFKLEDINGDKVEDLKIYSTSGQLITVQVFRYTLGSLVSLPFLEEESEEKFKEVTNWSSEIPEFIDLDNDEIQEVVFTHKVAGNKPTEFIEVKDFYRLVADHYQKYKDETNVLGNNFAG